VCADKSEEEHPCHNRERQVRQLKDIKVSPGINQRKGKSTNDPNGKTWIEPRAKPLYWIPPLQSKEPSKREKEQRARAKGRDEG
jgi:hypothetical protein